MSNKKIKKYKGKKLIEALAKAPLNLSNKKALINLKDVLESGVHLATKTEYVCNKGASLLCDAPKSGKKYITRHIRFGLSIPGHGYELVNVGIVGDIENSKKIILRPESACAPSFLFGSQRCNCYDQWILTRELAAKHNEVKIPSIPTEELEEWIVNNRSKGQGFIFIHLDSQNGMGSGAIEGYNPNSTETAFLRHAAEYTTEQKYNVSISKGFQLLGLKPDPRRTNLGYLIASIVLDCLGINKPLIVLTNNSLKLKALSKTNNRIEAINLHGRIDKACELETRDRKNEFGHNIQNLDYISFNQDLKRVDKQIKEKTK